LAENPIKSRQYEYIYIRKNQNQQENQKIFRK